MDVPHVPILKSNVSLGGSNEWALLTSYLTLGSFNAVYGLLPTGEPGDGMLSQDDSLEESKLR